MSLEVSIKGTINRFRDASIFEELPNAPDRHVCRRHPVLNKTLASTSSTDIPSASSLGDPEIDVRTLLLTDVVLDRPVLAHLTRDPSKSPPEYIGPEPEGEVHIAVITVSGREFACFFWSYREVFWPVDEMVAYEVIASDGQRGIKIRYGPWSSDDKTSARGGQRKTLIMDRKLSERRQALKLRSLRSFLIACGVSWTHLADEVIINREILLGQGSFSYVYSGSYRALPRGATQRSPRPSCECRECISHWLISTRTSIAVPEFFPPPKLEFAVKLTDLKGDLKAADPRTEIRVLSALQANRLVGFPILIDASFCLTKTGTTKQIMTIMSRLPGKTAYEVARLPKTRSLVPSPPGLPEDAVRQIIRSVLVSLSSLHKLGICHRDLKPDNVVVSAEHISLIRSSWLIDFGLAHLPAFGQGLHRCGSPGFCAPEVIDGLPYTTKVDIFSLGVSVAALLLGHCPFKGESVKETLRKNRNEKILFMNLLPGIEISNACQDFCSWSCHENPDARPTAEEARRHRWLN